MGLVPVPPNFCPLQFKYPLHQTGKLIEHYFSDYWMRLATDVRTTIRRIYIPIFWTDYYKFIRKSRQRSKELEAFFSQHIYPNNKYFTVLLSDSGIPEVREEKLRNVLIFGAGGEGDIPIPLICDSHPIVDRKRDILASFVGVIHVGANDKTRVRSRMYKMLHNEESFRIIEAKSNVRLFRELMIRSVFALCPRGSGKTSFRLYEALQMGTIPVYIYDEPWLPYTDVLDWSEFSVLLHIDDIHKLPAILKSHTPEDIRCKQKKIKELYDDYFSMEGVCKQIIRMLQEETCPIMTI